MGGPIRTRPGGEQRVKPTLKVAPLRKTALVLVVAGLTLAAISHVSAVWPLPRHAPGTVYTVLQMNLCLSGEADCYRRTAYPSVVEEASTQVFEQAPSAVTLNEVCSADAAEIAARTGYRLRFAAVRDRGAPIRCSDPGGRGVFGLAVLTQDLISSSHNRAFAIQAGGGQRRWLCATTVRSITVCTAHLTRARPPASAWPRCGVPRAPRPPGRRQQTRATVFGGDVNRQATCAPATCGPAGTLWRPGQPAFSTLMAACRWPGPPRRCAPIYPNTTSCSYRQPPPTIGRCAGLLDLATLGTAIAGSAAVRSGDRRATRRSRTSDRAVLETGSGR